jgi:hypothetical protein
VQPADPSRLPPSLARFLALWNGKRGARRMPARRDFSFEDLWPWLGRLNLIAVEGDDGRFVVFSETSTRLYGREMTGRRLSEFTPKVLADAALSDHRAFMAAGGIPMSTLVDITYEYRAMRWTRLVVPLADDERTEKRYFDALHVDEIRAGTDSGIQAIDRR